jgi:UDP-glucose 4-epimerase
VDLKAKKVLVTGGCGLIGSTITDLLLNEEEVAEVRVIDNMTRGTLLNLESALATGKVQLIRKDIRRYSDIRSCFDGIDVVFHQAAIRITACAEQWRECQEVLVDGTFNVAEACVRAGVRRLVAASSASVYGMADVFPTSESHTLANNRTWYGAAKIANEALYRAFHDMNGLDYVALRYFNVYGPRMDVFGKYTEVLIRWLDCLDEGKRPRVFGDGKQTMDFIFSEDVARANIFAAKSEVTDEVFNVGSGMETSLLELLGVLLRVTEHEGVEPEFLPERKVNPVPRRLADVSKAAQLLGFTARIGLEEGLRRLVAWREQIIQRQQREHYDPHYQTLARS